MWTYQITTGEMIARGGEIIATGYSGAPAGKNNPKMQNVSCVGPIPCGTYAIGAPFDSPTHGPHAMHLSPVVGNDMYGRDGFLIHGDSVEHPGCASEGCIIMPRAAREAISNSDDCQLEVIE